MRTIGAIAGFVPAGLIVLAFFAMGTFDNRADAGFFALGMTVGAVTAGFVTGPLARGAGRSDLAAAVAFAALLAVAYLLLGSVAAALEPSADTFDPTTTVMTVVGRMAYGLLYVPFWAGFASPFAIAWVIAIRTTRRLSGMPAPPVAPSRTGRPSWTRSIHPERLIVVAALIIVAYALFVAALPLVTYSELRPPWALYRPVGLFALMSLPACFALIGVRTGVRSLVVASGVLCLLQSSIAFSGVTLGFVVPALVLLAVAGFESWPGATPPTRQSMAAGLVVIGMTIGAWVALLALTEEVCWSASRAADGSLVYNRIAVTPVMTIPPGQVGGGCDGGTLTFEALAASSVLAIGALAIAGMAAASSRAREGA